MAIIYKSCTPSGGVPEYMCDPCTEGEKGRVRSVMFINKSLLVTLAVIGLGAKKNIETLSWIETQIEAGLIIIIPNVRGTYDGGAPSKVTGLAM